jgi:hypothetical protein
MGVTIKIGLHLNRTRLELEAIKRQRSVFTDAATFPHLIDLFRRLTFLFKSSGFRSTLLLISIEFVAMAGKK